MIIIHSSSTSSNVAETAGNIIRKDTNIAIRSGWRCRLLLFNVLYILSLGRTMLIASVWAFSLGRMPVTLASKLNDGSSSQLRPCLSLEESLMAKDEVISALSRELEDTKNKLYHCKVDLALVQEEKCKSHHSDNNNGNIEARRSSSSRRGCAFAEGPIKQHLIKCPANQRGNSKIYKWSIRVERGTAPSSYFGVATTIDNTGIYSRHRGSTWTYDCNGIVRHNGMLIKQNLPKFGPGSEITLILDLTSNGGILSASIDGRQPFTICTNMKSHLGHPTSTTVGVFIDACKRLGFFGSPATTKVYFFGYKWTLDDIVEGTLVVK